MKKKPREPGPSPEGGGDAIDGAFFSVAGEEFAVLSFSQMPAFSFPELSDAENEVARLVVAGLSNSEVATRRGTSVSTVVNQVSSILRKLGVPSRSGLAALVAERLAER